MLSFFSKKKQSPDTPPPEEAAIQGPADPATQNNGADEFIFVERKTPDGPQQPGGGAAVPHFASMYPPMPSTFGGGFMGGQPYHGGGGGSGGAPPYPLPHAAGSAAPTSSGPVPYTQDVPFELAPQLCTKSAFELTQLQVDGILAVMTRQMSVEEGEEYSFALERAVQNECY